MPHSPGTILQHLYFKERLVDWLPGHFIEFGMGTGFLSRILLDLGWSGEGYDLNARALEIAKETTRRAIVDRRFAIHNLNWLSEASERTASLVFSSMVLEHLSCAEERRFFEKCGETLIPDGMIAGFVPGSPKDWGPEDETAGHQRRYTQEGLRARINNYGWHVQHSAGLTFPISNLLLPISNALVRRHEATNLALSPSERTVRAGRRSVPWKTQFPAISATVLNETAMRPLHWIQKRFRTHPRALVIYFEAVRK